MGQSLENGCKVSIYKPGRARIPELQLQRVQEGLGCALCYFGERDIPRGPGRAQKQGAPYLQNALQAD